MQTVDLKSVGLYTHSNPLDLPPGALLVAKNATIDRPNQTETVRGSRVCFTFLDQIRKEFVFKSRLLVHHGSTLSYDSTGNQTFVNYPNAVNGPNYPIYATTANQNFYYTSSIGVQKIDVLTNGPTFAGVPQGLGGLVTLIAPVGNIVPAGQQVAYRIIWGYKDGNENTILGPPSSRILAVNNTGGALDVSIQAYIPDQIQTTNFFYQIYRSAPTAIGIAPLDEMFLLDEVTLTGADLVNEFITYVDSKTTTGATIYTAPSQQGIQGSNYQPPLCKDVTTYNQMNVYANIQTIQTATITLSKSSAGTVDGFGYFDKTGDANSGSTDIVNLNNVNNLRQNQMVEAADFPVGTVITAVVPPSTVNTDQVATGSSVGVNFRFMDVVSVGGEEFIAYDADDYPNRKFLVTDDIEETAISLCNAINAISTTYSAFYLGIGNSEKGKIVIQANNFGAQFIVASTYNGAFVNNMPITSSSDLKPHGLVMSKVDQPEAVPLGSLYLIGSAEFPIQRVLALRDGVYVFKQDGTWRGVGVDPFTMSFRRLDNTNVIKGAATAVVMDNNIYLHTINGASLCNQGGVTPISGPVRLALQKLQGDAFTNISFGMAYESELKYYLFCNTTQDDTTATQAFVFNAFTETWTTQALKPLTAAVVNYADDKMYSGNLERLRQERKNYDFSDYALDEVDVFISSIDDLEVTVTSTAGFQIGWFLVQNDAGSMIVDIQGNVLTLKTEIETLVLGAAKAYEPIETQLQWLVHGGNPTTYKHFQQFISLHDDSLFEDLRCTFYSDLFCPNESVEVIPEVEGGFGDCAFGVDGFGELHQPAQPIQTYVPLEQARAPWLNILLTLTQAYGKLSLSGQSVVFEEMDTRYR